MRADRLIALLMLLQRHGRVTARQVASELDISVSTARRDLEALSTSGVPVYSEAGRGGGWRLLGEHRTDLSGLTGPEVRALFLAAGSAPGQSPEVQQALRKLGHVVAEPFREEAEAAARAVFVDTGSVLPAGSPTPQHLQACRELVVSGRQGHLRYTNLKREDSERTIHPLGLVVRRGHWYLIADTERGRRMFRVDRIRSLSALPERSVRPEGFDLGEAWKEMITGPWDGSPVVQVTARARDWVVRAVPYMPGVHVVSASAVDGDGWSLLQIHGDDARVLASKLSGFAEGIQVLGPAEVLDRLAEIGEHLTAAYRPSNRPQPRH